MLMLGPHLSGSLTYVREPGGYPGAYHPKYAKYGRYGMPPEVPTLYLAYPAYSLHGTLASETAKAPSEVNGPMGGDASVRADSAASSPRTGASKPSPRQGDRPKVPLPAPTPVGGPPPPPPVVTKPNPFKAVYSATRAPLAPRNDKVDPLVAVYTEKLDLGLDSIRVLAEEVDRTKRQIVRSHKGGDPAIRAELKRANTELHRLRMELALEGVVGGDDGATWEGTPPAQGERSFRAPVGVDAAGPPPEAAGPEGDTVAEAPPAQGEEEFQAPLPQ